MDPTSSKVGEGPSDELFTAVNSFSSSRGVTQTRRIWVRRAEYALGKSIRKWQSEGSVATHGDPNIGPRRAGGSNVPEPNDRGISPRDFFNGSDEYTATNTFVDADEADFESAITEAKAEGTVRRRGQRNADGDKYLDLPNAEKFARRARSESAAIREFHRGSNSNAVANAASKPGPLDFAFRDDVGHPDIIGRPQQTAPRTRGRDAQGGRFRG